MREYDERKWSRKQRLINAEAPRMSHASLFFIFMSFVSGYYLAFNRDTHGMIKSSLQTMSKIVSETTEEEEFLSADELLGRLTKERIILKKKLMEEYGNFFGFLFDPVLMTSQVFIQNEASKVRLTRRFMIKLIEAQLQQHNSEHQKKQNNDDQQNNDLMTTFTWVTAGDSSAAGHGNLFLQSYTAVLEDTVKDAFEALGIQFVAKNYGMGGYVSAPELAMCMESVFGTDIDVLNWDFSMMEDPTDHRFADLWGNRAAIHPTKPILFLMDSVQSPRWTSHFTRLEQNGMGTVLLNLDGYSTLKRRIPDSNAMTTDEIDKILPPALQYFICDGATEGNALCDDPVRFHKCEIENGKLCQAQKWQTKEVCKDARFQASWHPGWKDHMLRGRLLGYYILEIFSDALIKYGYLFRNSNQKTDVLLVKLLQELYDDEKTDLDLFLQSPVDVSSWDTDRVENRNNEIHGEILYRRHAICHTALLPSHARFHGLLTDNDKGKSSGSDYEMGTNLYFLSKPEDGRLPLAFDPNDRQLCDALEIDHKDFFYVKEGDGWLSVTVPNKSELNAYKKHLELSPQQEPLELQDQQEPEVEEQQQQQQQLTPSEGLIMVCLKICPMGRCSDDRLGFAKYSESAKKVFLRVDGKPVTDLKRLEGCHFLGGENGIQWGPGQASMDVQQYDLQFRVEDPGTGHWLRISSIIVLQ